MPLTTDEKTLLGIGAAGLVAAVAVGLAVTRKPQPQLQNQISLSVPSTDDVGTPVNITAKYTDPAGNGISGATLYLFGAYSTKSITPTYSDLSFVDSTTTDSSGTATWAFTPSVAGYYYFDASDNRSNT